MSIGGFKSQTQMDAPEPAEVSRHGVCESRDVIQQSGPAKLERIGVNKHIQGRAAEADTFRITRRVYNIGPNRPRSELNHRKWETAHQFGSGMVSCRHARRTSAERAIGIAFAAWDPSASLIQSNLLTRSANVGRVLESRLGGAEAHSL